jgi:peptidoglycan/LPS O-acetylase OafA/YrhL
MPRNYSIFLDGVRFFAALMVLLGHFTLIGGGLPRIAIEHDGVVIFFLLSGYVIAYCAYERETELTLFGIARIARVLSVAVPALLLTMVLDRIGMRFNPPYYPYAFEFQKWYLYLPLFLSFTSELWFLKVSAFSNTPYWSLVYEVWYYIFFASIFFLRGLGRGAAALAVLLLMGPKIWLLAPLWFAGYGLYRLHQERAFNRTGALLLAMGALAAYCVVKRMGLDGMLDSWVDRLSAGFASRSLSGSQFFLGDYLKGICIFLFLFAARYCLPRWIENEIVARPIHQCAQFTFSLYLFHFPILIVLAAIFPGQAGLAFQFLRLAAVALLVVTLGGWCERQKNPLRRMLAGALQRA